MATLTETTYGKLLAKVRPRVITTEAENDRALAEVEALDIREAQGHALTPEEVELAALLTALIARFEETRYDLGKCTPLEALRNLMEVRDLRQRDLIPIFGASSTVSDVLNGKRAISKSHARKLAKAFNVPVSLFI